MEDFADAFGVIIMSLLIAGIVIAMGMAGAAFYNKSNVMAQTPQVDDRFAVKRYVSSKFAGRNTCDCILIDKETGVNYYYTVDGGACPLYNADGTLMVDK